MESIDELKKKVEYLEKRILLYEQNGSAKLYYSLNRKMNEMADILNSKNLSTLAIEDAKDKTFERLKAIWTDSSQISQSVKELGNIAGVTGDEKKDIDKKPFVDTIAESRK